MKLKKNLSFSKFKTLFYITVLAFSLGFTTLKAATPRAWNLRTNFTVNPMGVDNLSPRLSWEMQDDDRNEMQTAYQIIVASSEANLLSDNGDIWNTGKVMSDASNNISYLGTSLESKKRYYWKVKIWDNDGTESSWSEMAWWEMGFLDSNGWSGAKWISYNNTTDGNYTNYTIDVDFTIIKSAIGILFGAIDESNFYMWQVNYDETKSTVNFKPHKKTNGNWNTIVDFDITATLPYSDRNAAHHMKITNNNGTITTYIDETLIDTRFDATFEYGRLGFREFEGLEDALFDNLIVTNNNDASIIYSNNFDVNPPIDFENCTSVSGQLKVTPEIQLTPDNTVIEELKYTIDVDFTILESACGFLFGAKDERNFYMWQVNYDDTNSTINFRPHKKVNDNWTVIENVNVTSVIPFSAKKDEHHMKIDIDGSTIRTYLNDVLIDTREESTFGYGSFGFRENLTNDVERALFDNLMVVDGTGNILYSNDFNSDPIKDFTLCTNVNGKLHVTPEIQLQDNVMPDESVSSPMLRKEFASSPAIKSARVYATSRGVYDLYMNGERISGDILNPGCTDYNKRIQYQTFDVTSNLIEGNNVIGAILGDGWYRGKVGMFGTENYGSILSFYCVLHIDYVDGTKQTVISDESWKCSYGAILYNDMQNGEIYDARKEKTNWDTNAYDDNSWSSVRVVDTYQGELVAQIGPTVQVTETLPAQKITNPKTGVYIFDIGQNMAGWVKLKVTGEAGTQVTLRFGEMLNADGTLYTENLRTAKATDKYILKGGGEEVYEPRFTFHGFRYVEVIGYPGVPELDDITGCVIGSATTPSGEFECSSPIVNQLYSNIQWGQRGNFLSIPTDCPQRDERLGWLGDAQVFVRTASYNMDVQQFFEKWMHDVNDAQSPEGIYMNVAPMPDRFGGNYSAAWSDAGVIIPWTIYQIYGDTEIIENSYPAMEKYINFLNGHASNYLLPDEGYGDWLNVNDETPKDVLATAYYAYSVSLMEKMANALGKTSDVEKYSSLLSLIKTAFNSEYVNNLGEIKGNTQTSYLLGLSFDLLPEDLRPKSAQLLVDNIEAHNWHLTTGFVGISYLCPVLSSMGYSDVAYRLLLTDTYPSWLYPIKNGATTMWERWNSYTIEDGFGDVAMNSFNHYSYGSVGEWMFRYILGIDVDDDQVAYKKIIMRPTPNDAISYAKGAYHSVYGEIASSWELSGDNYTFNITIPANSSANLYLPVKDPISISEGGVLVTEHSDITVLPSENDMTLLEVGSGTYSFVLPKSALTTTIDEPINTDSNLSIYPNPAGNQLNLNTVLDITQGQIKVLDIQGKEVLGSYASNTIDVSSLNPGFYVLTLTTKDKKRYSRSFVKE